MNKVRQRRLFVFLLEAFDSCNLQPDTLPTRYTDPSPFKFHVLVDLVDVSGGFGMFLGQLWDGASAGGCRSVRN